MARYLLLVLILLLVVWLLRRARRGGAIPPPPPRSERPQDMVACARCGVHLPRTDALPGKGGVYCCIEHRREGEDGTQPHP